MKKEIKWIIITTSIMLMLSKTEIAQPLFNAFDNIIFTFTSLPVSPITSPLHNLDSPETDIKDFSLNRERYTAVKTYGEWKEAIDNAQKSLLPSLSLKIKDYDDTYNINDTHSNNTAVSCSGRLVGKTAFLTYTFDYSPNAKILAAYDNPGVRELLNEEELAALNEAYSIVERIITPGMTDYEKELALHDYIVAECTYDEEALKSPENNFKSPAHSITGLLLDKKGVCEAYANTFLLLCKIAGVECYLTNGDTTEQFPGIENSKHQWNIVKLDNEYYHIDLTYDDPLPSVEGRVLHTYFNLSDEELSETHIIEEHSFVCTGTKYNYFNYNNLNVSDNGEMLALLRSKLDQGIRSITFKTCNGYRINSMEEFYPAAENRGLNRITLSGELGVEGIYCVAFE